MTVMWPPIPWAHYTGGDAEHGVVTQQVGILLLSLHLLQLLTRGRGVVLLSDPRGRGQWEGVGLGRQGGRGSVICGQDLTLYGVGVLDEGEWGCWLCHLDKGILNVNREYR